MGNERNMSQPKEQEKSPQRELNEMEPRKLPDAEFQTMVIRMLNSMKKDIKRKKNLKT